MPEVDDLIENLMARNAIEHSKTHELLRLVLDEFSKMRTTLEKFVTLIDRLEAATRDDEKTQ